MTAPTTAARAPQHNAPVLTVAEISQAIKGSLEDTFGFVRVRGEISGFKRHTSGHLYFALKDAEAVLDAVCWRGTAGRLTLKPEDGLEVIASGRITTYPGRSKYQLVVETLELAGEGALLKLLEERRRKLAAEGLFAAERKKPFPFLPEVIGVVTSPTGAVIRDILHRLADRFPRPVLLWPVAVQGEGAAEQIAAAIDGFNALPATGWPRRPDILIVARGGGSLEDLWAFNEEIVVRAAAASRVPLIAAVGHETDTTLIDFAADRRAPTPTAAAEMAVPVREELVAQIAEARSRLAGAALRLIRELKTQVQGTGRGLPNLGRLVEEAEQRLDDWSERLAKSLAVGIERRRARLAERAGRLPDPRRGIATARAALSAEQRALRAAAAAALRAAGTELARLSGLLDSYSYQRVLERGFVLVEDEAARPLTSRRALTPGMRLRLMFHDGTTGATADGPGDAPPAAKPSGRRPPGRGTTGGDDPQGSLL